MVRGSTFWLDSPTEGAASIAQRLCGRYRWLYCRYRCGNGATDQEGSYVRESSRLNPGGLRVPARRVNSLREVSITIGTACIREHPKSAQCGLLHSCVSVFVSQRVSEYTACVSVTVCLCGECVCVCLCAGLTVWYCSFF